MKNALFKKLKDSLISILPITIIVIILGLTITPMPVNDLLIFSGCCALLVIGMSLFTLGADTAMIPIGQHMGGYLSKKSKPWLMIVFSLILGIIITIAEPDLMFLADQVSSVNTWVFMIVVSVGVGLFLVLGLLRIIFKWRFDVVITICYLFIFFLVIFLDQGIIPLAFDSGSVTTGPISVPFIMAFGLGIAAARGSNRKEDSFGLIGFASVGPILMVMLLMWILGVNTADYLEGGIASFGMIVLTYLKNVAIVLLPIAAFFILFQMVALKLPKREITRIVIGLIYTYFGITIFLVGVNVGFSPIGTMIGEILAEFHPNWMVALCGIIGFCMAFVEPAVQVLAKQIEDVTGSVIKKRTIILCIAIGVGLALMLCAIRIRTHISFLWLLVPAFALTLILSFCSPKLFVGMAYDSGGVATGSIATTFALPLVIGACLKSGGSVMLDAFGMLAFCAVVPVLVVLVFGIIYKLGIKKQTKDENLDGLKRVDIIEYD